MNFKQRLQILSDMYDDKYSYLYIPKEFFEVPFNEMEKLLKCMKINGCGPKGLGDVLIPEKYFGAIFTPACMIHNFMYGRLYHEMIKKKKTPELKQNGDRVFLGNLTKQALIARVPRWTPRFIKKRIVKARLFCARKGYQMVKWFGGSAYWNED